MRVWLAGSRSFGVDVLDALSELPGIEVVAVTAPGDKLAKRGRALRLPVLPVVPAFLVGEWRTDVIVSAQNYQWITDEACRSARYGSIGYHPSLLPRHRGRSAVEWTIAMGDPIAGGTVYQMDGGWDTGPIIAQDWCHVVPGWSASDLWRERLYPMGIRLLARVIKEANQRLALELPWCWEDGPDGAPWPHLHQDERVASTEPKWDELKHGEALGAV